MKFTYRRTYALIIILGTITGIPYILELLPGNRLLGYGFYLFNVTFWAWFGERVLRVDNRLARIDDEIAREAKTRVRIEHLPSPGPEYLGEEAT